MYLCGEMIIKEENSSLLRRDVPPLNVLTDDDFELLINNHSVKSFNRNELIFKENDEASSVMLLIRGKVKVFKGGVAGRGQIVKLAKPNDFMGYRSVMACENHTTSAEALEDNTTVIEIPKDVIFTVLRRNLDLNKYIIKSLAVELAFSRYRSVTLSQKQIRGRLAESLLVLRDKYGYLVGNELNVIMSREDLANLSNMTTSNAIRTLSNFVSENIVNVQGRRIFIINEPALERISRLG